MYIPKFNEEKDIGVLHSLIKTHPFGTLVTNAGGELIANHIPFFLDGSSGEFGTLMGHVARANHVWKSIPQDLESLVIFQGNHSYITPSWYPSKQEHGKAVPTWNYAVVHTYGIPKVIEDKDWLHAHVNQLTNIFEKHQQQPWKVSDAPDEYIRKLLAAIVGVEIPISRMEGKMKLGQNRSDDDQLGVLQGLTTAGSDQSCGLASLLDSHVQRDRKS